MYSFLYKITFPIITMASLILFDSNTANDVSNWQIVNDVVMGGQSSSQVYFNEDGQIVFEGEVSTRNNGGFSSVRYSVGKCRVSDYRIARIHLKGDGKSYQF